jgi:hypothetical protein
VKIRHLGLPSRAAHAPRLACVALCFDAASHQRDPPALRPRRAGERLVPPSAYLRGVPSSSQVLGPRVAWSSPRGRSPSRRPRGWAERARRLDQVDAMYAALLDTTSQTVTMAVRITPRQSTLHKQRLRAYELETQP